MANNYEQSEITKKAAEYVAQGMSPPEALAKARAEVESINNLPEEGLQGTMVGPELEAYKQANPMDFVPDNMDFIVNPNNPFHPGSDFIKWLQKQDEEKERRRAAMMMMQQSPRLRNPVTNNNPRFMGLPTLFNMGK